MQIESLITTAKAQGASDLHLEPGLPPALRIRGALKTIGDPISPQPLADAARELMSSEHWHRFQERQSIDFSRTLNGVRCRINILRTSRGIGFAIRLLTSFQATIEKLNLHPDLKRLLTKPNGLILLSGPTGCGKSSTMAALIQEVNLTEARHIVTIESPIEYTFRPHLSYIRQREVGRDTPSFEQALIDSLREDPDVLMVGEMLDPATMRLTLTASETGHLVLATMHSSTCSEALQRLGSAFPPEMQYAVRNQLADCLAGVICQRLHYREDLKLRVPGLEILVPTIPVKNAIRNGEFFKIVQTMETGADQGMWTWQRYQTWLDRKKDWYRPGNDEQAEADPTLPHISPPPLPAKVTPFKTTPSDSQESSPPGNSSPANPAGSGPIDIEPVEGGLQELINKLKQD